MAAAGSPTAASAAWQQTEFYIGALGEPRLDAKAYRQAAAAGFNLVVPGPWSYEGAANLQRLDVGAETGMRVLLSLGGSSNCSDPCPAPCPALQPYHGLSQGPNDALAGYWLPEEPPITPENGQCASDWAAAMHLDDQLRNDGHDRMVLLNFSPDVGAVGGDWFERVNTYVNDHPSGAQLDVAAVDLYPWRVCPGGNGRCWGVPGYFQRLRELRTVMGIRPFWIVSYLACGSGCGGSFVWKPDSAQLRFEAFAPAAAGAKGVLWYRYRGDSDQLHNSAVRYSVMATDQARWQTSINMYLRGVVGPVAMSSTHRGLFFQSPATWDAGGLPVLGSDPAVCPVDQLGNPNLATGVFQPTPGVDEFYLFIVNLSLAPTSSTVALKHSYAISRGPSAVGYIGGNSYGAVGTASSFPISLAGGEGRMYRVAASQGTVFEMVNTPGDVWLPGMQKTITWQGGLGSVDATLYPDVANIDLAEPQTFPVTLASGLSGNSAVLTMPSGIRSRRARLVLTSVAGNQVLNSGTNVGFRTTGLSGTPRAYYPVAGARGFLSGRLRLDSAGQPRVVRVDAIPDYEGSHLFFSSVFESRLVNGVWEEELVEGSGPFGPGFPSAAAFAYSLDALGRPHVVYGQQGEYSTWATLRHLGKVTIEPGWEFWVDWPTSVEVEDVRVPWVLEPIPGSTGDLIFVRVDGTGSTSYPRVQRAHREPNFTLSWTDLPSPTLATQPTAMAAVVDASETIWLAVVSATPATPSLRVYRITATACEEKLFDGGAYRLVDITLDSQGRPEIAFTLAESSGAERVGYWSYNGSSWNQPQVVDTGPHLVNSLAIASQLGSPRIAYCSNGLVTIASPLGSSWYLDPVGALYEAEGPVSLECSAAGDLWVCFRELTTDRIVVYGPGGGGDPGCTPCAPCDPCPILPAITVTSENPMVAGGALTFSLKNAESLQLELALFDVAGRRVADDGPRLVGAGTTRVSWSLEGLGAGVYFLRARIEGAPALEKRVVIVQ